MATADVQLPQAPTTFDAPVAGQVTTANTPKREPFGPHDVETVLHYFKPNEDGSPPHATYVDRPETYERPFESHPTLVRDVSGREHEFTLDANGFQFVRRESTEKEFVDDDKIKASYYPEVEQLLKDVTGASRILIFDHTIRREKPTTPSGRFITVTPAQEGESAATDAKPRPPIRGPVQRVHIDQSYEASLSRVPHHVADPAEAARLLRGRVEIINVWRPIGHPVERDPLAVAEAHSVPDADLVPTPLIYPTRRGETYQVRHGDGGHRWFYKSGLAPDEAILIKCFDSKTDGRARRVPHTAFEVPGTGPDVRARQSIEVRALVFHEHDVE